MIALLRKDFLPNRGQLLILLVCAPLYVPLCCLLPAPPGGSSAVFAAYFVFFCGFGATLAFFQNDEKSRTDSLVLSLPVSRRAVVSGRYLSIIIATIIPSIAMAAFWALFRAAGLRIDAIPARGLAAGLAAALLFNAISLPILFRFGAQKSGMAVVFVFFIPVFAMTALKSIGINPLSLFTGANASALYLAGGAAAVACLALSFAFSLRLYGKRQF